MARYKSCFKLKNILLIIFIIMISTKFILKESFKEGNTDENSKQDYPDNNPNDYTYFWAGAHGPVPSSKLTIAKGGKFIKKSLGINDSKSEEGEEDKDERGANIYSKF